MRGFPKGFATKQDFYNSVQLYPEQTKRALLSLWRLRFAWRLVEETDEEPQARDGCMVQERKDRDGNATGWAVYEWAVSPDAEVYRLGFTDEEVLRFTEGVRKGDE